MNWRAAGATALAVALTVPFALPFAYLLVRNAGDLSGLWGAVSDNHLVGPLLRSLVLGASVALAAAVLGTAAAWLVARTDLRARRTWALLLCLPLPTCIRAFARLETVSPGHAAAHHLGPQIHPVHAHLRHLPTIVVLPERLHLHGFAQGQADHGVA